MSHSVTLIGITAPVYKKDMDAEGLIVYMARVSNPENQDNMETAPQLIRYLIKHKHWSPFEMVNLCMEIRTTRDISRQILRHRSFSFQEFSQRYAESQNFLAREARLQDTTNRQNSIEVSDKDLQDWWWTRQNKIVDLSKQYYEQALERGIAKEQARVILPEGNTETKMYMNGTLRSWIHYCQLRMGPETQKEHRELAKTCWDIIKSWFPNVHKALEWDE